MLQHALAVSTVSSAGEQKISVETHLLTTGPVLLCVSAEPSQLSVVYLSILIIAHECVGRLWSLLAIRRWRGPQVLHCLLAWTRLPEYF